MTRITLGQLKEAIRKPHARYDPSVEREGFPTPFPMATRAVRVYHENGPAAAHTYLNDTLDRSSYWGPAGAPGPRSWADAIRGCFDNYIEMATDDLRPTLGSRLRADVETGPHEIGVNLDVVLLDPAGYVGRYLLWELDTLDTTDSQVISAPIAMTMGNELGMERVAGVEIWHLRSAAKTFVETPAALEAFPEVERIADAYIVS